MTDNEIEEYAQDLLKNFDGNMLKNFNGRPILKAKEKIIGIIDNGEFLCCEVNQMKIFKRFLSMSEESYNEAESMTEFEFQNEIAKNLISDGWDVKTETSTSFRGRIDIIACKSEETKIIETKLCANINNMSHALGQLLFYKTDYPDAQLYIATPVKPKPFIIQTINFYGVKYYE